MPTFILNNKTIKTTAIPGMSLLDFIRNDQQLTGTKIGCREGDCGACTVLSGSLKAEENIIYRSITSCISPLGNAHGKHIITVEGINLPDRLTQAQAAMRNHHASQCGFCTPGFVVSLTGFVLSHYEKNEETAQNAIGGNICRCTGYKSIKRAIRDICDQLKPKNTENTMQWLVDHDFIPAYFLDIPARLRQLDASVIIPHGKIVVSGGTDLYVQKSDELAEADVQLIFDDKDFKGITIEDQYCNVGSGNTVTDLWEHPLMNAHFPKLKQHLKLVSSEPIRNMASFGGNLVNASPIGDMTIFFLALNSTIILKDLQEQERQIPLHAFYKAYKTLELTSSELVKQIRFKLPPKPGMFNFEKVCKRTHLDIATVNSAMHITIENHCIQDVHIALGGVAPIPKYLHQTVAFLKGKALNPQNIIEAATVIQSEITPISDVRGSAAYKRLLARQLFFAHFTEIFPDQFTPTDFKI